MTIDNLYKEKYNQALKQMKLKTGNIYDAEDIVQNAFERCVKFEQTIGNLEACFPFILKNCFHDWQREKQANGMTRPMSDENLSSPEPNHNLREFLNIAEQKKGNYGNALVLFIKLGYNVGQISAVLNLSKRQVHRYLEKFVQEIKQEEV